MFREGKKLRRLKAGRIRQEPQRREAGDSNTTGVNIGHAEKCQERLAKQPIAAPISSRDFCTSKAGRASV